MFDFSLIQLCEMYLELVFVIVQCRINALMYLFTCTCETFRVMMKKDWEKMPNLCICAILSLEALFWCSASSVLQLSFVSLSFMKLFEFRSGNHCKHCGYHCKLFLQRYSEETGTREADRSGTTHVWWQLHG